MAKRQEAEIGRLSETAKRINEATLAVMLPLWADNIAQNMPRILEGESVDNIPKRRGEPAVVIAAGPSLKKKKHLKVLAQSGWKHPVITCDRNLIDCLSRKIVPYCVCTVDGNPKVAEFYDHRLVRAHTEVYPILNIATSPKAVEKILQRIWWFIPLMDDAQNDPTSLTRMLHFMTHKPMLVVGGNVGTLCWNLAMYLECNPIILIGFDFSYDSPNITKGIYYKALMKMLGGDKKKVKRLYAMGRHPVYGNKYVLDPIFKSYLEMFRNYASTAHKLYGVETINCTEGGAIFGEGIECLTLKEALRRYN